MLLLRDYGTMSLADDAQRRRSVAPRTASRWSSAQAPPSRRSRIYSAGIGPPRRPCICRTARCRRRERCSTIRRSPPPMAASCAGASAGGGREGAQIEHARKTWSRGVAEAIDRFCRTQEVMDVTGEPHRGVLRADDMANWHAHVEAPLTYDYRNYSGLQDRPMGARAGDAACSSSRCSRASTSTASIRPERISSTCRWNVPSFAYCGPRDLLWRSRFRAGADVDVRCCRMLIPPSAAASSASARRWSCGPARSRASGGRRQAAAL